MQESLENGRRIDVLLAEDAEADADLVREILGNGAGRIRLSVVRDGDEAIAFLGRRGAYADAARPDLILLDLKLPGTDGHAVLRHVKADRALRAVPVVVLSGSDDARDIADAYAEHANCYVAKPQEPEAFFDTIRSIGEFWSAVAILPPK